MHSGAKMQWQKLFAFLSLYLQHILVDHQHASSPECCVRTVAERVAVMWWNIPQGSVCHTSEHLGTGGQCGLPSAWVSSVVYPWHGWAAWFTFGTGEQCVFTLARVDEEAKAVPSTLEQMAEQAQRTTTRHTIDKWWRKVHFWPVHYVWLTNHTQTPSTESEKLCCIVFMFLISTECRVSNTQLWCENTKIGESQQRAFGFNLSFIFTRYHWHNSPGEKWLIPSWSQC